MEDTSEVARVGRYLELADEISTEATCPRANCGAILVNEEGIVVIGVNGASYGEPLCKTDGCVVENNHCVRAVHAETRALCTAAKIGIKTKGATVYSVQRPCQGCLSLMAEAGIIKVWYKKDYHTKAHGGDYCSPDLMNKLNVELYVKE